MDLPLHNNYSHQSTEEHRNAMQKGIHTLARMCTRKWCWRCSHHNFMHCFTDCFRETNAMKLKSFKNFFLLLKDIKTTAKKRRKTYLYILGVTKMDNSGVKAMFPSQRLAGQERRKTAKTLVHLQYHNLNSQALRTTVPSLDFQSRTIKSSAKKSPFKS